MSNEGVVAAAVVVVVVAVTIAFITRWLQTTQSERMRVWYSCSIASFRRKLKTFYFSTSSHV